MPEWKIRLNRLDHLDDPMEQILPTEYKCEPKNDHKAVYHYSRIQTNLKNYKIACFCQYNETKPWKNLHMWSQYADKFKGVCLVLSKEKLQTAFADIDCPIKKYSKVDYQDKKNYPAELDTSSFNVSDTPEAYIENLIFIKNKDFSEEKEYRVACYCPSSEYQYIAIKEALNGVILGAKTSSGYNDIFKNFCNALPCKRLCWNEQSHVFRDI